MFDMDETLIKVYKGGPYSNIIPDYDQIITF